MRQLEERDVVDGRITRPDTAYDCPACNGSGEGEERTFNRGGVEIDAPEMCQTCTVFWKFDSKARGWVHEDEFEAYCEEHDLCTSCAENRPEPGYQWCGPCMSDEHADHAYHSAVDDGLI